MRQQTGRARRAGRVAPKAALPGAAAWVMAGVLAAAPAPAEAQSAASAPTPAASAAAQAAPATPSLATAMAGPLKLNPQPFQFALGNFGPIYATGVLSGLGLAQTHPFAIDHTTDFDLSNAQMIVQKVDGLVQFYAQTGVYSLPALGAPYLHADTANTAFFGPLPEGYLKLAPTSSFSIEGGKLPSLIGAEYTFTFENMNIERGLLWNQEPAISRGVQANYTAGPLALAASLNDGFYSGKLNWGVGSAAWTINPENSLTVVGGRNFGQSATATFATPLPQNNSEILNLIYTYSGAPWTVTPYFQFTHVPKNASLGIAAPASTFGGAVLVNYAVTKRFNIAGRAEVIGSTGSGAGPNLLYGPGSLAWSLTATPTWQIGRFFLRGEGAFVKAEDVTPGLAFGKSGNATSQLRFVVEAGFLF